MGYTEAIEWQARLVEWWRSPQGVETARQFAKQRDAIDSDAFIREHYGARSLRARVLGALEQAEPFYVAPDICRVVMETMATFPDAPLGRDLPPCPVGFFFFGEALRFPVIPHHPLAPGPLRAIAWSRMDWPAANGGGEMAHGCSVSYFHLEEGWAVPALRSQTLWPDGDGWAGWQRNVQHPDEIARHMSALERGYFMALLHFLQQRVFVTSSRPVLHRAARRRIARVLAHEPLIRVVELRRRQYPMREAGEHEPAEWSCRWLVRGHWHRYHTRGGLEPRWVNPYVKGPDHRPFKAPRATVYEVVR